MLSVVKIFSLCLSAFVANSGVLNPKLDSLSKAIIIILMNSIIRVQKGEDNSIKVLYPLDSLTLKSQRRNRKRLANRNFQDFSRIWGIRNMSSINELSAHSRQKRRIYEKDRS